MKRLLTFMVIALLIGAVFFTPLLGQLMLFIVLGQIPFTSHTVSPTLMIIFWSVITPVVLLIARHTPDHAWRAIESFTKTRQRSINIRAYRQAQRNKFMRLATPALLHIASQLPESLSDNPELYLRRRFVALPA